MKHLHTFTPSDIVARVTMTTIAADTEQSAVVVDTTKDRRQKRFILRYMVLLLFLVALASTIRQQYSIRPASVDQNSVNQRVPRNNTNEEEVNNKETDLAVSCGGHYSTSCAECPQGHGEWWCNGHCQWDESIGECVDKVILVAQLKTESYPQFTVAPDPYADIPEDVRRSWGPSCHGNCSWDVCANSRDSLDTALRTALSEWNRLTQLLGIMSINCYGSLIASLYRNTTLMKWDTDIDVLIWAHDTAKLEAFAKSYNSQQEERFKLVIQPDWRNKFMEISPDWGGRHYNESNGVSFVAPNLRLYHYYEDVSVDIDVWAIYADDHGPEDGSSYIENFTHVQILQNDYEYAKFPGEWMFPPQPCYLEGIKILCPAIGSKVLRGIYNADVRVPNHHLNRETGCWEYGAPSTRKP